jgi:malonate-semialdehyde dehydrogenase (acetylating)/methylmalonate-semialdehyde dehydrogenase
MKTIPHWINGQAKQSGSGRFGDVFDPALGAVASKVGFADQADIDATVARSE